ncbi:MAG: hypothetical protein HZB99_04325 [Candidatus Harrisonbacteria bacterium]|nr:hypothetical protein [Candidatus Harrisonbacteria bacterium]
MVIINYKNINAIIKILFLVTIYYLLIIDNAFAQTTPQLLISWKALSYVPAGYQGKIFPTNNTPVEVGFDVIDNGKVINLSKSEISWELNGKFLTSGIGLKTARFNSGSQEQAVRITVLDYKEQNLTSSVIIPSLRPEIMIESKLLNKKIKFGKHTLTALPYFFNAANSSELSFDWKINGERISASADNPESLNLDLGSQVPSGNGDIVLSVTIKNFFNEFESAIKRAYFVTTF